MEPLTFGQKLAFLGVVAFVVTLTALPFAFRSESSSKSDGANTREMEEGRRTTRMLRE